MYVLIDSAKIIHALTESKEMVRWWRKRDAGNLALNREIINTREDWVRFFDPGLFDYWIRAGEER